MRIDLPLCNFKNCRYSLDGNCTNKNMFGQCDYTMTTSIRNWIIDGDEWIDSNIENPVKKNNYFVLVFDKVTYKTFNIVSKWDGRQWVVSDDNIVIAWCKMVL